jgi:hypothetical protein
MAGTFSLAGAAGQPVAGPLKQLQGRIIGMNGSAHVQLALPSLGWFAQVVVARGHVKKLAYL